MKKLISVLFVVFLLAGCSITNIGQSNFEKVYALKGETVVVMATANSTLRDFANKVADMTGIDVLCRTHVQDIGWQSYVKMGQKAGTEGRSKRLEAFQLDLKKGKYQGGIKYSSHVQNIGWQNYVADNKVSGTEGRSLRVEAIKIELTGEIAKYFDIYYRTHCENYGWLGWAKNGYSRPKLKIRIYANYDCSKGK